MKAFIAAAALAVAGTGASAAVYEADFTVQATEVDAFFESRATTGDIETGSISFEDIEGFRQVTTGCSLFGYQCRGGEYPSFELADDGEGLTYFSTLIGTDPRGIVLDFASGTGYIGDDDYSAAPDIDVFLRFDILDSDLTISDNNPEVAPVPLPASAPLLAMGLGGLAWWRRRAA